MRRTLGPWWPLAIAAVLLSASTPALAQSTSDLRRLSLEDLVGLELTTVSRVPQTSLLTPAAVFVITAEDIRRSGVTTIVGALRLAPGVHVTRLDANKWAVGIRGFSDRLARSMLVLIDGRAVYSPLFAGTYWEVQDTLLPDIERIEVIRGPGGTLWGANAVNGIVNILTKDAAGTGGWLAEAGTGSFQHAMAGVRYGGSHGDALRYRVYAKFSDRGPFFHADGRDWDAAHMSQAGFRADWNLGAQRGFTLQGDAYGGEAGQRSQLTTYAPPALTTLEGDAGLRGGNVLARWHDSVRRLQVYFDRTNRTEPTFQESRNTLDLDFQHLVIATPRHQVLWGASARLSAGDITSVETQRFLPEDRTDALATAFLQDEITLVPDRWRLTLGAKLERNSYSGVEVQPSARLLWTPRPDESLFASVTRAVRTPSRVEQDFERTALVNPAIPQFLRLQPNDDFASEKLVAYEAGHRFRPLPSVYVTTAAFFNHVTDILSTELGPTFVETTPAPAHVVLPLIFDNGLHGNTHGVEVTGDLRPRDWLRWTATYSLLRVQLTRDPGSRDASQEIRGEKLNPRHQFHSHLSLDLGRRWELDWLLRGVGRLANPGVPAYATSDLRVGYRLTPAIDLSVVGRDLHQGRHLEFPGGGVGNAEVERSAYVKVTFRR